MSGRRQDSTADLKDRSFARADVARGDYFGMVLQVGRGGDVVFEEAIGAADAEGKRPLKTDDVFSIFSVTKAFTNILILQGDRGGPFRAHHQGARHAARIHRRAARRGDLSFIC